MVQDLFVWDWKDIYAHLHIWCSIFTVFVNFVKKIFPTLKFRSTIRLLNITYWAFSWQNPKMQSFALYKYWKNHSEQTVIWSITFERLYWTNLLSFCCEDYILNKTNMYCFLTCRQLSHFLLIKTTKMETIVWV